MFTKPRPAITEPVDEELVAASIPDATAAMWVTPELARLWLHRNDNNRPLREHRIKTMAHDMEKDHWYYTGEPIKFSVTGKLVDGQHRLKAIVKADATIKMLVVIGVPDEAQAYMDSGAKRTASDALSFRGEMASATLAAACRFGAAVDAGTRVAWRDGASHADIIEWLASHPEIRRYALKAQKYASKCDLKPSVMAYAFYRMSLVHEKDAEEFFTDLIGLRSDGPGDPIYALLDRVHSARRQRERLSAHQELWFLSRAWNARRAGHGLRQLRVPTNEYTPVEFK